MATPSEPQGIDKVANLLALLVVKDMTKTSAIGVLVSAGFSNREIAGLLNTTEATVRATMSAAKKKAEKPEKGSDG